jgi:hypothetical protein
MITFAKLKCYETVSLPPPQGKRAGAKVGLSAGSFFKIGGMSTMLKPAATSSGRYVFTFS